MSKQQFYVERPEVLDEERVGQLIGYSSRTVKNLRLQDKQRMEQGGDPKGPPFHYRNGRAIYLRREVLAWIQGKTWADRGASDEKE